MTLPSIGMLWIGGSLSWLEQLCVQSFLDNGHEVVLFTYDGVENVPAGVRMEPASDILPTNRIIRHAKTGSPAYHADLFRLNMLRDTDLIWADTDAYCHQPWDIKPGTHFHGWISDDKPLVNNGVLGLPKDSKTLAAMLEFTSDEYPIPPWFKRWKRDELQALKDKGTPTHVSELPWGVWGPNAVSHFLKETGEISHSFPGHVIYPVPFKNARAVFVKKRLGYVRSLLLPDTLSIHFWGRRFRNIAGNFDGRCEEGSLVDALLAKHRIDTRPTAHMMRKSPEALAAEVAERAAAAPAPAPAPAPVAAADRHAPEPVIAAIDRDEVDRFCDINASAPDLAAAFYRKFGSRIIVVFWGADGDIAAPPEDALSTYVRNLTDQGVPKSSIAVVKSHRGLRRYDVVASINGFGMTRKIGAIEPLLNKVLGPDSRLIIDISKGSGTYPFLKKYGSCNTLVQPTADAPGRAVMSAEPREGQADWGSVARELAGTTGFYKEVKDHSFLHVKRGKTLVVTFDNLDIAMNKRDDRRPWGYSFIEKNGWSMLGVMANGWTWFREPQVSAEFDRLRDEGFFAQFGRVVFYGASMGGYGAAAFSAAAPGSTVFAISPQSTLDKSVVPWEMRYKTVWGRDFSDHYGDASASSQTAAAVHLLFDPYVPADAGHAERYSADNVIKWRCPLLGHRLGSSLNQMGVLQHIARDAINGVLDRQTFYQHLRERHDFPRYQRELANLALERGRPDLAKRVCAYVLARRSDKFFRQLQKRLAEGG